MSSSQNLVDHPSLGYKIFGKPLGSTIQYRGLKYASIPGRWKDSILTNSLPTPPNRIFDATKFGPSCPHKRGAQAWDLAIVGNVTVAAEAGQAEDEKMDEFECLNVNVTVPRDATLKHDTKEKDELLPVFVWVHGGGLAMGSNSWPQYDLSKFVQQSVQIGKPVIGVAINYRVGILGFLASQELGIEGNYGYKDQVNAFRWIKKHIRGFGGDPENVTAAGESAGGISLSTLLCADVGDEGLFERVVLMSGDASLRKPRNRHWHEAMYRDQLRYLGWDGLGKEERTRKMRETDAEEMCQPLPIAQHFCAFVDGKWMKDGVTLKALSKGRGKMGNVHCPRWCKDFVVGDTAHDGTVLKGRILDYPNALPSLYTLCKRFLTPAETDALLSAYQLTPSSTPEQQKQGMLFLASELRFYLPSLAVHRGWKSASKSLRSSRYHFHVPNPTPGNFTGLASHELDVAFLLQNMDEVMQGKSKVAARQTADHFIKYVNGEGWAKEQDVKVFGENGVESVKEDEYDGKFRNGRGAVLERIGVERLWVLAEAWQGVRSEEGLGGVKAKL